MYRKRGKRQYRRKQIRRARPWRQYRVGIEVIRGDEHFVEFTDVFARNKREAEERVDKIARVWYPEADSIYVKAE